MKQNYFSTYCFSASQKVDFDEIYIKVGFGGWMECKLHHVTIPFLFLKAAILIMKSSEMCFFIY